MGRGVRQKTAADGIAEIANKGIDEVPAGCVLILAACLPFFAMKEVGRVFGVEKVREMFGRGQGDTP